MIFFRFLFNSIKLFLLSLDFVYRRTRIGPQLSEFDKLRRYLWCKSNMNTDFDNFIFVDETTIRVAQLPLYHVRQKSSTPQAQCVSNKKRFKVNLWGGISKKGSTPFIVS